MNALADLADHVAALSRDLAEIQRRQTWQAKEGKVAELDEAAGLYRVDFGGGFLSPWLPVEALSSGALRIQAEPVSGQTVKVVSQSGDMTDGIIALSSFSDANGRPHNRAGELKVSVGGTVITGTADSLTLESNGSTIVLDASGITASGDAISIDGNTVSIDGDGVAITGSGLTHNGTNVGDDHQHGGVMSGPAVTGPPA